MASHSPSDGWIGASLLRKEDARHLHGHGMFIADVRMPGVQDIAFVRSQMAHAIVRQITKPAADAGNVFTLDDLGPLNILEAGPELAAHRHSPYPALADDLSTEGGHVARLGLSQALGLPENKIRVIAPDVGGGFGGKNRLMPEDIAVAAIAMKVGHPVRWIEDRREHLMASVHARDHFYDLTVSVAKNGTLLGIEGDIYIDAGAYSLWPTGSFMEASMASRNLTGPYRIQHLALQTFTVATNKAPMGPYRGVARPGACFAIQRLGEGGARALIREPFGLRGP